MEKKNRVIKIVLLIFVLVLLLGILGLLSDKKNMGSKYVLETLISDTTLQGDKIFLKDNKAFIYSSLNKRIEIYDLNTKQSIKDKALINSKVYDATVIENDDSVIVGYYFVNNVTEKTGFLNLDNVVYNDKNYLSYAFDDNLIVEEENKNCVYNVSGAERIPCVYDYLQHVPESELFVANKDNKVGVIDINNKIIIPLKYDREYDCAEMDLFPSCSKYDPDSFEEIQLIKIDDKSYFRFKLDNNQGIISEDNKIIVDFGKNSIYYDAEINKFYSIEYSNDYVKTITIYSLDGVKEKTINLDPKMQYVYAISLAGYSYKDYNKLDNVISLKDKNSNIYVINDNLDLISHNNVAFVMIEGMDEDSEDYLKNKKIYIANVNDEYKVYNSITQSVLINETFKYINMYDINSTIVLCKNVDKTMCGVIDTEGKIISDFKYDLHEKTAYHNYELSEGNNYFKIIDGKETKRIHCENKGKKEIIRIYENFAIMDTSSIMDKDNNRRIFDLNCNELSNTNIFNERMYDDMLIITVVSNSENKYDIYDEYGKLIHYKNRTNTILKEFLGYIDKKAYFITNRGLEVFYKK